MINKSMNNNSKIVTKTVKTPEKKPNELGGIQFSSHVKIYDPNTKEVLVNKRGDL